MNLWSRMNRRYCKHVMCQTCMKHRQCVPMPASWEVLCCWAPHPVLSITSGFSNTTTLQRGITTTAVWRRSCRTHENCMHAEQIIIIFYIFFLFFALCFQLYYTEQLLQFTSTIFFYIICYIEPIIFNWVWLSVLTGEHANYSQIITIGSSLFTQFMITLLY